MLIRYFLLLFFYTLLHVAPLTAQTVSANHTERIKTVKDRKQIFRINKPNYKQSPLTGVTRKHWLDAALYMLSGAFSYIHKLEDSMKFPKQPGKSYPKNDSQLPTEKLEGLCRTLFMAVPLLKENPLLEINGIKVADYYRYQIGLLIDTSSANFIKHRSKNGGPNQVLVEFGALSVSLFAIPELLWEPLTTQQKNALAATMISYGDGPTVPSNWKFFNIFVMSFFKGKGYAINEPLLLEYLEKSLAHYSGDGWYNDNPAFDYYSMWAFQMYGMVWAENFGKKYYPQFAQRFLDNFKPVKNNYPYLFGRTGEMIMWGRSITYRFGSTIPFALMGYENDPSINYGWMRRIASGAMLSFLQHPNFMQDSVPTLGFYGAFEPAVQSYSCRGSAFWMGKAFLSLLVPADNPYWTAIENEGPWEKDLHKETVYNQFLKSPEILVTNYPNIGAAELRAWCHVPIIGAGEPFRGSENYNRLAYNSAFPWQADGTEGQVAMNYVFKNKKQQWEPLRLFTFKKYEAGIFYRNAVLETNNNIQLQLADIPLPNGILRIDNNISTDSIDIRLGHYALPMLDGAIKKEMRTVNGYQVQIINNGVYQLAMVSLSGWDSLVCLTTAGLHPQSNQSAIINALTSFVPMQPKPVVYATLLLWKKANQKWKDEELIPVKKIVPSSDGSHVIVYFINGDIKDVAFN